MGDDKITKKGKNDKLTRPPRPSGSPNLQKMRKDRLAIQPAKDKVKMLKFKGQARKVSGGAPSLQVLMMFDITGSMFKYFDLVRKTLKEITQKVKKESPNAEFAIFAYRNHGDEDRYDQIYYTSPMTDNLEELFGYISAIERGGGGPDALTCMEDCLWEANKLVWDPRAPKAIVVIGDMPPHGVVDSIRVCRKGLDYKKELEKIYEKLIKIYSVYAGRDSDKPIKEFYQSMARESGGKFITIDEINILKELLIGICMKETGNLDNYIKRVGRERQITDKEKKVLLMLNDKN